MIKIGDKLLCKRNCNYLNTYYFDIDKYYLISGIVKENNITYWIIEDFVFSSRKKENFYLLDYFYTKQEVRGLKLEKLNDVR